MNLAICVECGEQITEKDEMLPDYPGLYQCPKCSHPNGDVQDVWVDNPLIGRPAFLLKYSSIKGFMGRKDPPAGDNLIYGAGRAFAETGFEPIYKENDSVMGHEYLCPKCGVHLLTAFIGKEDYKHCIRCGLPFIWPSTKR